MKHLEIKTYTHKGIDVTVKLDYDFERISLVKRESNGLYSSKKYLFAERESEYMNGWLVILEAMQYAIKEAKKEMDQFLKEQKDRSEKVAINLLTFNKV